MMYNVLQYLEQSARNFPDKLALADETENLTWQGYAAAARRIGTFVVQETAGRTGAPVAVLIDRNIRSVVAFMGVVYSGNFYVPIDTEMPETRIRLILDTLRPILVIDARTTRKTAFEAAVPYADIITETEEEPALLQKIRDHHIDTDPLYAIFTSGSTGVPKGVVISHRSVIDLVGAFEEAFAFPADAVFGNQAPFDFDVSVKDLYNAMYLGATVQVLPRKLFKLPKLLVDYLRDRSVTTLIWAVSALRIIADFKALDGAEPLPLRDVMFSGEVMPVKSLNYWADHLPAVRYVNLYGPTEITCNCTYHVVSRRYENDEMLPVGKAFRNSRVFLLGEEGNLVTAKREIGEICVAGTCLGLGYWNNPEKTAEAFAPDPFLSAYPARIYRTGDMGFYDDNGDLVFASRRDYQIKHMGHRIELGEIEVALNAIPFLTISCCLYDEIGERIICHYQADADCKKEIVMELSKKLPKYMWPNIYVRHDALPLNKNGKIDRVALKAAT